MLEAKFACFSTHCKIKSDAPQSAIASAVELCARVQERWNFHSPASALSRRNFAGEKMPLDADEVAILRALLPHLDGVFCPAKAAHFALAKTPTGGAESGDIFGGGEVSAANLYAAKSSDRISEIAREEIAEAIARKCLSPGQIMDFGGVMKEAAVDLCAQHLAGHFFIVNFGGDLRANRAVKVLIKNPANPQLPAASVQLEGGALCTSACYERGEHIAGARNETASATVVAPRGDFCALECGIFSTKMLVANPLICPPFGALRVLCSGEIISLGSIDFCPCV